MLLGQSLIVDNWLCRLWHQIALLDRVQRLIPTLGAWLAWPPKVRSDMKVFCPISTPTSPVSASGMVFSVCRSVILSGFDFFQLNWVISDLWAWVLIMAKDLFIIIFISSFWTVGCFKGLWIPVLKVFYFRFNSFLGLLLKKLWQVYYNFFFK